MSTVPPAPDLPPRPGPELPAPQQPELPQQPQPPQQSQQPERSEPEPPVGHPLVVPSTRTSGTWTGIGIGLFALLIVVIFIGQNTKSAPINFLWLHGSFPVGLAVLLAFVLGGIVVLLLGVARLAQLRLMARRHRRGGRT